MRMKTVKTVMRTTHWKMVRGFLWVLVTITTKMKMSTSKCALIVSSHLSWKFVQVALLPSSNKGSQDGLQWTLSRHKKLSIMQLKLYYVIVIFVFVVSVREDWNLQSLGERLLAQPHLSCSILGVSQSKNHVKKTRHKKQLYARDDVKSNCTQEMT